MTKINLGSLWKPAKNPNGGSYIVRSAHADHTSKRVHEINRMFAKAAEGCKGKDRAAFRTCVANEMEGKHAA